MKHLPFWLAEFIHHTIFFLLPMMVIAFGHYLSAGFGKTHADRINKIYARLEKLSRISPAVSTRSAGAYLRAWTKSNIWPSN
jgi:hypothetical protein